MQLYIETTIRYMGYVSYESYEINQQGNGEQVEEKLKRKRDMLRTEIMQEFGKDTSQNFRIYELKQQIQSIENAVKAYKKKYSYK